MDYTDNTSSNNALLEYLLEQGMDLPEQMKVSKQSQIADMLRAKGMQSPQGRQAGRVYVAPNPLEVLGQLGYGYAAKQKQAGVDESLTGLQQRKMNRVREMRDRMGFGGGAGGVPDYGFGDGNEGAF
jgi:hypothetical protein